MGDLKKKNNIKGYIFLVKNNNFFCIFGNLDIENWNLKKENLKNKKDMIFSI